MQRHIPISSLPVELSVDDAVAAACATDLAFIEERLRLGQSVLVECGKELTLHLLLAVRARFRRQKAAGDTSAPVMSIVDGRGGPDECVRAVRAHSARQVAGHYRTAARRRALQGHHTPRAA